MREIREYLWIKKDVSVGAPDWTSSVRPAATCPDQREYRRLSYSERERYLRETWIKR